MCMSCLRILKEAMAYRVHMYNMCLATFLCFGCFVFYEILSMCVSSRSGMACDGTGTVFCLVMPRTSSLSELSNMIRRSGPANIEDLPIC